MKFIIRQTYTMASLVAMVPASVWAVCNYNSFTINNMVGVFPYFYLVVCQLMIVPRYTISAIAVYWLGRRFRNFDMQKGCLGFVVAGILVDIWVTISFAARLAQPPEGNWALMVPLFALGYGLVIMLAATLAGGFIVPMLKHKR